MPNKQAQTFGLPTKKMSTLSQRGRVPRSEVWLRTPTLVSWLSGSGQWLPVGSRWVGDPNGIWSRMWLWMAMDGYGQDLSLLYGSLWFFMGLWVLSFWDLDSMGCLASCPDRMVGSCWIPLCVPGERALLFHEPRTATVKVAPVWIRKIRLAF